MGGDQCHGSAPQPGRAVALLLPAAARDADDDFLALFEVAFANLGHTAVSEAERERHRPELAARAQSPHAPGDAPRVVARRLIVPGAPDDLLAAARGRRRTVTALSSALHLGLTLLRLILGLGVLRLGVLGLAFLTGRPEPQGCVRDLEDARLVGDDQLHIRGQPR